MADNDMDRVVPLGQLDDFKVADGEPDVRGWEVLASDGRKIGEVDELLVDTAAMKVRYLDVDVDDGMLAGGADRHVLIPIGYARLREDRDCVMVDALAAADLGGVPSYDQGPLTRDFETSVRESFSARRGTRTTAGLAGGSAMVDTAGMDYTPGPGTGLGMTGMSPGTTGGRFDTGMRASTPELGMTDEPASGPGLGGGGGDRISAGSQGPAGGMRAGTSFGGPGALNERADELGYDREAVEMRGDASHRAGLSGSDYQHNADEDFYASDAFDDARFYGSRRPGGSPDTSRRGNFGLSGGADLDPPSGSGPPRDGSTLHGAGTGDVGTDRDETSRLAREASERLREDREDRGVGGTGNL